MFDFDGNASILLHRALMSSNTSGFFLWGMMLEPVVNASGKNSNPKFWLAKRQISLAILETSRPEMTRQMKLAVRFFLCSSVHSPRYNACCQNPSGPWSVAGQSGMMTHIRQQIRGDSDQPTGMLQDHACRSSAMHSA